MATKLTQSLKNDYQILMEVKNNLGVNDDEYTNILSWALEKLRVTCFSYVYACYSPTEISPPVIMGNYPEEWVILYQKKSLYKQDPVIKKSCQTSSSFFWDKPEYGDDEQQSIFKLSSNYGIEQGFTVPIHEPGNAFGSIHFASEETNTDFREVISYHGHLLHYLSFLAHQYRPAKARQEKSKLLTPRETECLHWVAMGKTYEEIATILNISERTVKYHTRNIIEKMDAVNIKQAMAKLFQMN
ncbi:helix-turn-helix transcriptional regulator [Halomonas llamarensis]|uniref:LuxR family transcriptional regulator n=1 Tax=Halomonas llamarensis TaxID=2945104 RepID=A0ABT0SVJ2_9GAMM|nr:LuxR family transcriptional regulator [Halomonas llamarensis]MCL7931309.1 LuxR family transcriptional regulator [Halomonas llamarensis]